MSLIAATAMLLSPVFGFLIAIGVEMLIGGLKAPFTTNCGERPKICGKPTLPCYLSGHSREGD
jgi:hypothetical protein